VKQGVHLSGSSVQQRSNDLLGLARAPGVRMLNVGVSTIEQDVGEQTTTLASSMQCSVKQENSYSSSEKLVSRETDFART